MNTKNVKTKYIICIKRTYIEFSGIFKSVRGYGFKF